MNQRYRPNPASNSESIVSLGERILVTGSNGFIGTKVVAKLLDCGFTDICCFVRPSSHLGRLRKTLRQFDGEKRVEIATGDLLSPTDCQNAAAGASIIFHLAAGMEKSFAGAFMNSAVATRNLLDAFVQVGEPKRFVNISSFAVYSTLGLKRGAILDEGCPLEDSPQERYDAYGFGKLKQEEVVRRYGSQYGLPYVILRPGYVFGPGKQELSGRVAVNTFGFFIQVNGSNLLPLSFVDNCADAIVMAGLKPGVEGEVFNVVDDELLSGRQFFKAFNKNRKYFLVCIPYVLAYLLCLLWEKYSAWSGNQLPPVFNRRRCAAEWKRCRYSNEKLRERLDWKPRITLAQAMAAFLGQFDSNSN
jgi:nucleoside-diphosphate-sugar epimerase